jgi:hypothetical protein
MEKYLNHFTITIYVSIVFFLVKAFLYGRTDGADGIPTKFKHFYLSLVFHNLHLFFSFSYLSFFTFLYTPSSPLNVPMSFSLPFSCKQLFSLFSSLLPRSWPLQAAGYDDKTDRHLGVLCGTPLMAEDVGYDRHHHAVYVTHLHLLVLLGEPFLEIHRPGQQPEHFCAADAEHELRPPSHQGQYHGVAQKNIEYEAKKQVFKALLSATLPQKFTNACEFHLTAWDLSECRFRTGQDMIILLRPFFSGSGSDHKFLVQPKSFIPRVQESGCSTESSPGSVSST